MRRIWFTVIALALVVGLAATAYAMASRRPISSKVTLHFKQQVVANNNTDVDPPGQSLGDGFVSSALLFQKGTKVGRMEAECILTNTTPLTALCHAGMRLDSGQVELLGRIPGKALSGMAIAKVAVVGGTGAYEHSHGHATFTPTPSGSKVEVVLTP